MDTTYCTVAAVVTTVNIVISNSHYIDKYLGDETVREDADTHAD